MFCRDASIAADLLDHFHSIASFKHPVLCPCGADIPVTQVMALLSSHLFLFLFVTQSRSVMEARKAFRCIRACLVAVKKAE